MLAEVLMNRFVDFVRDFVIINVWLSALMAFPLYVNLNEPDCSSVEEEDKRT